ncbi:MULTISPECIES: degT/DnrJ/EryC1/StrS aminotransferase [Paenibacillus]|uniref:degT/DnrJ/EryC1/StrS aminotransferase n=1 Tax=Paenibacillus TaxID=44249 RepID=UPI0022B916DA|nr:degT/DnrJ/EryC1/StrS aminotransferase [Paenibacillus caseinilyticus]MCZ8521677.1 degT/DnrJ/EryC1/StrS aminotransferase [Paenibacillus caseinilyticus]
MKNVQISKEHFFSLSFVLSRVLTSGVIMSIEKNESELKGLEKSIGKLTNKKHVALFNSYTGAVHAALWGQDIVHGSATRIDQAGEQERKFLRWLGVELTEDASVPAGFERLPVSWDNLNDLESSVAALSGEAAVLVLDFTPLGFGPAAAIAASDPLIWKKAERLKIFGAFDLQTMWTQEESEPDLQPAVQFNYRLSPLVAACVKLSLLRRNRENED